MREKGKQGVKKRRSQRKGRGIFTGKKKLHHGKRHGSGLVQHVFVWELAVGECVGMFMAHAKESPPEPTLVHIKNQQSRMRLVLLLQQTYFKYTRSQPAKDTFFVSHPNSFPEKIVIMSKAIRRSGDAVVYVPRQSLSNEAGSFTITS